MLTRELSREEPFRSVAAIPAAVIATAATAVVTAVKTRREEAMNYTNGIQDFSNKSRGRAQWQSTFMVMIVISDDWLFN